MPHVVVEISHPPFGHEHTFAGLYVATACLSKGMDVIVVLRGDGVYTGMRGQVDPQKNISLPATEAQIEDILELDGTVVADAGALIIRGIESDELIEGIQVRESSDILALILKEGEKIIAF